MGTGRGATVPVGVAAFLLVAAAVAGPLYVSSAASAAARQQLDDVCPSDTALGLSFVRGDAAQERFATELGATLATVQPATRVWGAAVEVPRDAGVVTRLQLMSLDDQAAHVDPPLGALGPGELAMSATNAELLGVEVGDEVPTVGDLGLRLVAVFDDVPFRPVEDFWCGWVRFLEPDSEGDPPPPFALAAPETFDRMPSWGADEHRVIEGPLTLAEARAAARTFNIAVDTMADTYGPDFASRVPLAIDGIVQRATAVRTSVSRTLAPVEVTALAGLTAVLVAAAVLLARARRSELRLLVVRGVAPPRLAVRAARSVAPAVLLGAGVGAGVAAAIVRWWGPAPAIESRSVVIAAVTGLATAAGAVVVVAVTMAVVADRWVDATRRRSAGWIVAAAGVGMAVLAVVSFRRLDRDGGVRSFGVETRGGALLPMSFPLLALLSSVVLASLVVLALAPRLRLTGRRLGRAVRLGWRRVVMEGPPLAAIVAAVALAAGCLLSSWTLAEGSRDGLRDKAEVYVGADLWIAVYDDPTPVTQRWPGSPSTVELTATGTLDGDRVDVVGIDRATFAAAARLRSDADGSSLDELADLVAPNGGAPAPAITVGSGLRVGDVTTVQSGRRELEVQIVATPDFFPAKTSHAPMIVVDTTVADELLQFPVRVLLVTDPPEDAVGELQQSGVRTGVVRDVERAFDGSAYSALRWAYTPLAALGVVFAVVALALQLLVVSARMRDRRAVHVVMRRTGFGDRSLWIASFVEAVVPLALGVLVGAAVADLAARLAVPRLDPMPSLAPSPVASTPWPVVVVLVLVVPVWSALIATLVRRLTVRADPLEVMHGAL